MQPVATLQLANVWPDDEPDEELEPEDELDHTLKPDEDPDRRKIEDEDPDEDPDEEPDAAPDDDPEASTDESPAPSDTPPSDVCLSQASRASRHSKTKMPMASDRATMKSSARRLPEGILGPCLGQERVQELHACPGYVSPPRLSASSFAHSL